jgi:hypothetical protein
MINEIDVHLRDWILTVVAGVDVSLGTPGVARKGEGINLYLLSLAHSPPERAPDRVKALEISLRYLITTWSSSPESAHQLLGKLVFAAMQNTGFKVDLEPPPLALWSALGAAPQPAFAVIVPMQHELPQQEVKYVLNPLRLKDSSLMTLQGVLLGPEDRPIVGAYIELSGLNRSGHTDNRGQFRFNTVPGGPYGVLIRAKGREFNLRVESVNAGEPVVIRLNLLQPQDSQ